MTRPGGVTKRRANVPAEVLALLDGELSKADLWEITYQLASLLNEAGSCDDEESTLERIIAEANAWRTYRELRKGRPVPPGGSGLLLSLSKLRAKREECVARIIARRTRFA